MTFVVTARKIITADDSIPVARFLTIADGRIAEVGTGDPPDGPETIHIDGVILPGLIDAHVHLTTTGLYGSGLDFRGCRSVGALIETLESFLKGTDDEWVIGGNFDPGRNEDGRMPTSAELDAVSAGRNLLVSRADGHSCTLNGEGMRTIGLDRGMIGIDLDPSGMPTGILADQANYEARRRFFSSLPAERILEAQHKAAEIALSRGVTSVHEMAGGSFMGNKDFEVLVDRFMKTGAIHVRPYLATTDVGYVKNKGLDCIGGDLFLDGSIGSRTAAMFEPYADHDGCGHLYHDDEEITEWFVESARAGLQAGVHAIGDAAIEQAISCMEEAFTKLGPEEATEARRRKNRIEHFECVSQAQIERAARLGIAASVQPMFDRYWGGDSGMYRARLGDRARSMNPFNQMLRAGMLTAGGSDSTVTPLDPFLGMSAAMAHTEPGNSVDFDQALKMFSSWAAIAGQDPQRGSLSPGKVADLCVVPGDPSVMTPEEIGYLKVIQTWRAGRPVWEEGSMKVYP